MAKKAVREASKPAFDPGAAATFDGIYGLPTTVDEAKVIVIPVPWDGTTSYRRGTALGPAAVLQASYQVDLFDLELGRPYEAGIAMAPISGNVIRWNREAAFQASPIIKAGGAGDNPVLLANLNRVNRLGDRLNRWVRSQVEGVLADGKMAVVLGGDHSTPFGALQAYAERYPRLGVLHFDAHFDLRDAFEGFNWSHASIMFNVLNHIPGIATIVHVGIRDFSEDEYEFSKATKGRSQPFFDAKMARRLHGGTTWKAICEDIVDHLPSEVYISFDVDGLDPRFCPGTGTPVAGGLDFQQVCTLLEVCIKKRRRIVGCDLNEVAPRKGDGQWNANVGSRLLYKMIGYALKSQRD